MFAFRERILISVNNRNKLRSCRENSFGGKINYFFPITCSLKKTNITITNKTNSNVSKNEAI